MNNDLKKGQTNVPNIDEDTVKFMLHVAST